jgi:Rad3-related DNA helicase
MSKLLPKVVKQIEYLLDHHKDDKGIIHTHSHKITTSIKELLYESDHYDRLLFRETGSNNEDILQEHTVSDIPSVLVSPSLTYGVDLKDDLGRFQIIVKLPYLPLSSKRIKQLFEEDKSWYENKMLNNLVQATGRTTRSEEDYSTTYILDGNIKNTMRRAGHKLPKHFIDRFM